MSWRDGEREREGEKRTLFVVYNLENTNIISNKKMSI